MIKYELLDILVREMVIFGLHVFSPRDHNTDCATLGGVTVAPTRPP
jgi:hypothetical protein